ncbi:ABC transporter ATP-binding protein [Brevibacillus ginsengisoli]|uniref:ABC transporter ATP-binding protein n=1 Tax=Brevibacillus ginsengisoli TaxID=363854 RepID=UPI003CFA53F0
MKGSSVIRRLIGYARHYQKSIWIALFLLILGTGAELAGPFIAKIAIDDHILSIQKRWYAYSQQPAGNEEASRVVQIGSSYLIREDWLSPGGQQAQGQLRQVIAEGKNYYLIEGELPKEGQRVITPSAVDPHGRQLVTVVVQNGNDRIERKGEQLSADEVLSLYRNDFSPLLWLFGGYAMLIVASAGINYVQLISLQTTAQRIIQRMRIDLFAHLQKLPVSFFDRTPVGSLVSRVTNDTEAIREMYVSVLATFAQNGVYLIGILIALFLLQPKLAMFCCLALPILTVLVIVYRMYSSKAYALIRARLSDMNAMLNEMIQNMVVVQAFRREKGVSQEFNQLNNEYFEGRMRENKLEALLLRPAVDFVYNLTLTLIIWYFGSASFDGFVSFGILYAFIDYMGRFFEPINMIMQRLSQLQQAITASERVFAVLDEPTIAAKEETNFPRPQGRVVFDNVSFGYNDQETVLRNVSFTAEPGQTVALVGHTGSGKSSIMNLLLGFYEIKEGKITIDGQDMSKIKPEVLREHVGLVLQDPFLFTGDISFNIRLYNEQVTNQQVLEAAQAVRADEFIRQLPQGYQEPVVERGATLSSGQRQLISFARALAHNPAILILDEATANIDSETESAIQEALYVLSSGRTTFMIAHRLSTIQHADQILVLSRGEIIERGNHEELMANGGLYYKMYQLQLGQVAERVDV